RGADRQPAGEPDPLHEIDRLRARDAAPRRRRLDGRDRRTGRRALGASLPLRAALPISLNVSEPDIILTENAAKRVAAIAARQSKPAILRLAVDGGGCAGFTYKFELADAADGEAAVAGT